MARRNLQRARVILTGASSGIGRELARQLVPYDARLVLTARREDRLRELAQELGEQRVAVVPGDITDPELRKRLVETACSRFGGLDVLVNNAGVGAIGPFATASHDRLRRIMDVNFFAPAELMRLAIPVLAKGERPIIVNVSSVLGHRAVPKKSEYCASKFALHGFSDAVRAELARQGIDLLLVSPSTTASEFFENVLEKQAQLPWLRAGQQPASTVARRALRAIRSGRHEIILTPGGKLLVWLDRLAPPIINRLVAYFG